MGDLPRLSAHAQAETGVQAACLYQAPSRGRRRGCRTRRARARRNAAPACPSRHRSCAAADRRTRNRDHGIVVGIDVAGTVAETFEWGVTGGTGGPLHRDTAIAGACFLIAGQPNSRGGVLVVCEEPPFVRDRSPLGMGFGLR
jgi:hypothetical protein